MASNSSGSNGTVRTMIGIVFVGIIGVGSWFGSPYVLSWLQANVGAIGQLTLSNLVLQIGTAVVMFIVLMLVFSILLALVQPGDKASSSEAAIAKERDAMMAERRRRQGRSGSRKREKR